MKRFEAFESEYFRTEDLDGKERELVIDRVEKTEVRNPDSGRFEAKPVLYFKDERKGLILNRVNWSTIETECGEDTVDWNGSHVILRPDRTQFGARMVPCMRIKIPVRRAQEEAPPPGDADAPPEEAADDIPF